MQRGFWTRQPRKTTTSPGNSKEGPQRGAPGTLLSERGMPCPITEGKISGRASEVLSHVSGRLARREALVEFETIAS